MSNSCRISKDGAGKKIVVEIIDDSTGTRVSGKSSITISLADLEPDSTHRVAKFQWLYFKDANNACADMKCLVLMTAPEAA